MTNQVRRKDGHVGELQMVKHFDGQRRKRGQIAIGLYPFLQFVLIFFLRCQNA